MKKTLLLIALLSMIVACSTDNIDGTDGSGDSGESSGSVWDGKTIVQPEISDNHYLIRVPANLAWLAKQNAINKNVKFLADIDMGNKPFKGIKEFSGIFDGDNKSIKNLVIEDPLDNKTIALIREVANDTTIKYLTLANGTSKGSDSVAGFVGEVLGTTTTAISITIDNSTNKLEVITSNDGSTFDRAGGFIANVEYGIITIRGSINSGKIETTMDDRGRSGGFIGAIQHSGIQMDNLTNSGDIISESYSGGIIGYNNSPDFDTTIINSSNKGNITSNNSRSYDSYSGGIIGYNDNSFITIIKTYNKGTVTSTNNKSYAGGIIGHNRASTVKIEDTYNKEEITSSSTGLSNSYTGGIIGYSYGYQTTKITIENVYNIGNIKSTNIRNVSYAGGIIGQNSNTHAQSATLDVISSYNTGQITSADGYAGGIIGHNDAINSNTNIRRSSNIGTISSNSIAGGIIGHSYTENLTITDSYNANNISGTAINKSTVTGGIIGRYNAVAGSGAIDISRSYSYGDIRTTGENTSHLGAIIGEYFGTGTTTYTDNFWYAPDTTNQPTENPTVGTNITANNFKLPDSFTNWKIGQADSAWEILPNAKYPALKNKPKTLTK